MRLYRAAAKCQDSSRMLFGQKFYAHLRSEEAFGAGDDVTANFEITVFVSA